MFQLTFLGTGATVPSARRGLSALLVEHETERFLVDCGEGTLRQIRQGGVGVRRLDRILLTHGHLDHILGLASLVGTLDLWDRADRLTLYGSEEALRIARVLLDEVVWPDDHPGLEVTYAALEPGPLCEVGGVTLSAFPVRHHETQSFGFRFDEAGHRPLDGGRLAELGVPEGKERQELAHAGSVTLPDGRLVRREEALGTAERGASLAVVGDCQDADALVESVRGVDLLVIEATYRTADEATARTRGHLTVADACRLARLAEVGRLVLTHQSDRYDPAEVEAEARAHFEPVMVAKDFDRVEVRPATRP